MSEFWKNQRTVKSFAERPVSKYITNVIDDLINKGCVEKVLDVGCGGGRYSKYLLSKGMDVTAIDSSHEMINSIKDIKIKTLVTDMSNINIYNELFDLIISIGVLHNAKSKERLYEAIEECNRLCKIGGFVLCSIFTNDIIDNDLTCIGNNKYEIKDKPSMTLLSKKQIIKAFNDRAFTKIKKIDEHTTDVGSGKRNVVTYLFKKNRNLKSFISDYNIKSEKPIDMSISGKFLAKRKIDIDLNKNPELLDSYAYDLVEKLKKKIRAKYKIKNNLVINAGANGVLQNLLKIFFVEKGELLTTFFSFEQPQFAVLALGGKVNLVQHNEDFSINFDLLKQKINKLTKAIYICNPNNPTGICEDNNKIIDLAKSTSLPVIVDESGIDFAEKQSLLYYNDLPDNLIVVHSFSKAYGFAGLRTGYAYMSDNYVKEYYKKITTHGNSHLSLYIIYNYFEEQIRENIQLIKQERDFLYNNLQKIGFEMIKSDSNTLMSKLNYDKEFFDLLEKNGISVIKVTGYNNKCHFRIAVQDKETNEKFINKLKDIKDLL